MTLIIQNFKELHFIKLGNIINTSAGPFRGLKSLALT